MFGKWVTFIHSYGGSDAPPLSLMVYLLLRTVSAVPTYVQTLSEQLRNQDVLFACIRCRNDRLQKRLNLPSSPTHWLRTCQEQLLTVSESSESIVLYIRSYSISLHRSPVFLCPHPSSAILSPLSQLFSSSIARHQYWACCAHLSRDITSPHLVQTTLDPSSMACCSKCWFPWL